MRGIQQAILGGLAGFAMMLAGACSPSAISSPWNGASIDLLQKDQEATITPAGEKDIKVSIKISGTSEVCEGSFTMIGSHIGIPLINGAVKSYKGTFGPAGAGCQKAIGNPGNVSQFMDIRDNSIPFIGDPQMILCNQSSGETLCLAANTFKIHAAK